MRIVIASGKGGAGKTTVTACLAAQWKGDLMLADADTDEAAAEEAAELAVAFSKGNRFSLQSIDPKTEKPSHQTIVAKMNDLFAGDITEADFIGSLTTWQGRLMTSEALAAQAKNNTEEQFALGSFKDEFMDVVIEAQDAQNSIAEQMLKDERIMGVMQKMLAKMVWKQFQQAGAANM